LLALHRAEVLDNTMKDRRQVALKLLQDAENAFREGRPREAMTIRRKLFDDYSRYTDLADLFPSPQGNVPEAPAPVPSPQPDASSPSQPAPGGEPRATRKPGADSAAKSNVKAAPPHP
jgi:hypothetical protein